jgi:hypothetical protein
MRLKIASPVKSSLMEFALDRKRCCLQNINLYPVERSPFAKSSFLFSGSVRHLRNLRGHTKEAFAICETIFLIREKLSRLAK